MREFDRHGLQPQILATFTTLPIVANVAAIVDELERTFVAEIAASISAAPTWFEPGR